MALITYLTRIHFADRVVEDALSEQIRLLGILRPLIITDAGSLADGPLARVIDALPPGCKAKVSCIEPGRAHDKSAASVRAAFQDGQCDGYIGLGSEFILNLTRRVAHELRPPDTRLQDLQLPARQSPRGPAARPQMIAIPTSIACVGLQPVIARSGRSARRGTAADTAMLPDLVLCDPTLTLGQSQIATAAAGMDTLAHCIEAYLSMTWNPPADGMALDGIRRASSALEQAVHNGSDLDARREMMAAALDAGLAAQKGLGSVEALAHAIEDELRTPVEHGYLHAALLPPVLAFNAPAINGRMAALRGAMDVLRDEDISAALSALSARIHLPPDLRALQLDSAGRERVARRAAEHPATRTNPRHATTSDYVRMLEDAG